MKYWIESSFESEDKPKEYPECLVVVADYGEGGTESIGFISLPEDDNGGDCPTLKSELMDVIKRINLDKDELESNEVTSEPTPLRLQISDGNIILGRTFESWVEAKHYLLGVLKCHCGWHSGCESRYHPNGEVYTDKYNTKWFIEEEVI